MDAPIRLLRGLPWSVGNNTRAGMAGAAGTPPFSEPPRQDIFLCHSRKPSLTLSRGRRRVARYSRTIAPPATLGGQGPIGDQILVPLTLRGIQFSGAAALFRSLYCCAR